MKIKKQMVRFGRTPNELLNNANISLKAKGLFAYIESKPDDWEFSVESLKHQLKESTGAITAGLHELEDSGFLKRDKHHGKDGKWEIDYILFDRPYNVDEPYMENPYMDEQYMENIPNNIQRKTTKKDYKEREVYYEQEKSDYQDFSSQTTKQQKQSEEALSLSEYLRKKIVENFPNNRAGKDLRVVEKWAIDIEKMIRIDGRKPEQILGAINFAMSDNFWKRIIWSGANLRKHYDRLDADATSKFMKNGTIVI